MQQIVQGFEGRIPWPLHWRNDRSSLGTWLQFHPYRATGCCSFLKSQDRNDGYHPVISWLLCPPGFI